MLSVWRVIRGDFIIPGLPSVNASRQVALCPVIALRAWRFRQSPPYAAQKVSGSEHYSVNSHLGTPKTVLDLLAGNQLCKVQRTPSMDAESATKPLQPA
jgi:hypothetical protein